MAKMTSKLLSRWIVTAIDRLHRQIAFSKEYDTLYASERRARVEAVLSDLSLKNQAYLLEFEIAAGIGGSYQTEAMQQEIKQMQHRYHLLSRRINQSERRALSKRTDVTRIESIHANFAKKRQNADTNQRIDLSKIQSHFQPKARKEAAIAALEVERIGTNNHYLAEEVRLHRQTEANMARRLASTAKKNTRLLAFIAKLESWNERIKPLEVAGESPIQPDEILRLDDLSMHFGGLKAVDHLSFAVKRGEIFGLIGPNGAGKTTVFNCITRFYKPTGGNIYYRNRQNLTLNLNQFKVHNIIKEGIVRTFQNVELIWELPVIDNLLVAAHTLYRTGFFGQLLNVKRLRIEEAVLRAKAAKILADLDMTQYSYMYPLGLPYGILKKVELARTLMINPELIILDEPAAGLNDLETLHLAETIKKIRTEYHATIFLVEHDMGLVMDVCDTICAISFGKKLAIGTPNDIQQSKVVREAYLGGE